MEQYTEITWPAEFSELKLNPNRILEEILINFAKVRNKLHCLVKLNNNSIESGINQSETYLSQNSNQGTSNCVTIEATDPVNKGVDEKNEKNDGQSNNCETFIDSNKLVKNNNLENNANSLEVKNEDKFKSCPVCQLNPNRILEEILINFAKVRNKLHCLVKLNNNSIESGINQSETYLSQNSNQGTSNCVTIEATDPVNKGVDEKNEKNDGQSNNCETFIDSNKLVKNNNLENNANSLEVKNEDNSAKKRPQLPKLVLNLMKDSELKKKLKEVGLPIKGVRKVLEARYQRYCTIYNAECDKKNPRSAAELLKQCNNLEKLEKSIEPLPLNMRSKK
ncbi:Similar to RAD18: E3 ubiquitin-protein ligase RAD18 (Homo sapiens) [Cotesia congregata]|uniref:Similar to RAD18: E3 ubiquitin-protein ligase RAD18 (Homo sapiens) n=1 Tax=Cotesia congregata TaxID=51543 RepID=A0A8J2H5H6_COTCN|nr:Similar to RAD18: E3 ubiquitin-protein ligase RAD18 (Homo sapiens) [Cotesia congregata]